MNKIVVTTLLCMCMNGNVKAQLTYSLDDDSGFVARFEKKTNETTNDSVKAYNFLKLSIFYKILNDTVKAKSYLNRGIALNKNYPMLVGAGYYYTALAQYGRIDHDYRERYFLKADSVLKNIKSKEAAKLLVLVWYNYGITHQTRGDEKAAMEAFTTKAAIYARECGDAFSLGKIDKAIGIIYMNANDRRKAATYYQRAALYFEKPDDDNPTRLEELVDTYITIAENYAYMEVPDTAKIFLDKAAPILAPNRTANLNLRYYFAAGTYYNKVKDYANAIKYFNKGISLTNHPSAQFSINRLKLGKYNTYMHIKHYGNAVAVIEDLLKSPYLAEQDRPKYYKELYSTYSLMHNSQKSLYWAKEYITLSDSLYESGIQKDILEMERKYNNAESQKKIIQLQADKDKAALSAKSKGLLIWLLGIISAFFLVSLIVGRLYFRNAQKLSKQKEINYQQQLQEAEQKQQIQISRALLQGEEKERKRLAGDLHDGLGGMLAGVKMNLSRLALNNISQNSAMDLTKVIDQLDNSVSELRRIARNMMPESLLQLGLEPSLSDLCQSLNNAALKVEFQSFGISKDLPSETQVTIYRIVQELLNNTTKHAQASNVLVQCSQNENLFFITVEDNGRGFITTQSSMNKGIGLTNITNRVDFLNGKLEINSQPGEGTTVNIEFNV
jgi:two-component system, NarL family, sensor kinase